MSNNNHKWYAVQVYSGFEKKVAQAIQEQADRTGLSQEFSMISVPSENVNKIQKGKKTTVQQSILPGYVLVKMNMQDATWHLVNSTPKVTGFLGNKKTAYPLTEEEANRMLGQSSVTESKQELDHQFTIGEVVKVAEGPFASFNGVIDNIDWHHQRLTVSVSIFGRATPVELDFTQIEKPETAVSNY